MTEILDTIKSLYKLKNPWKLIDKAYSDDIVTHLEYYVLCLYLDQKGFLRSTINLPFVTNYRR